MKWKTLDEIVNSVLIQKGYSVHFYFQCLKYASDCLRELSYDTLRNVRTKKLDRCTAEDGIAFQLPCDFVDALKIGFSTTCDTPAHGVRTSLRCCNQDGSDNLDGTYWRWGVFSGYWIHNPDRCNDGYKVSRHENKLEVFGSPVDTVILHYISDCSDADNASEVDPYAQATIESYIKWKLKEHNRSYNLGEVVEEERKFMAQYRILRARKNTDLTLDKIKSIFIRGYRTMPITEYY